MYFFSTFHPRSSFSPSLPFSPLHPTPQLHSASVFILFVFCGGVSPNIQHPLKSVLFSWEASRKWVKKTSFLFPPIRNRVLDFIKGGNNGGRRGWGSALPSPHPMPRPRPRELWQFLKGREMWNHQVSLPQKWESEWEWSRHRPHIYVIARWRRQYKLNGLK